MTPRRISQIRLARHNTDEGLRIAIEELERKLNELISVTNELIPPEDFVAPNPDAPQSPTPGADLPDPPPEPAPPEPVPPYWEPPEYEYEYSEYELVLVQNGLVFLDEFDRPDGAPGGDYVVRTGGAKWEIDSERLKITSNVNGEILECVGGLGGEMFIQSVIRAASINGSPQLFARFDWNGGSFNGFMIQPQQGLNRIRIYTAVNGAFTMINEENVNLVAGTNHLLQVYIADGVQEARIAGVSNVTANSDHDGQNSRTAGFRSGIFSSTQVNEWDDYIWMRSKFLVVAGVPTGWKVQVLNAADGVVAEATESGGEAKVDCSEHGGATEIVPVDGWSKVQLVDDLDQVQSTFEGPIYPGHELSYQAY